MPVGSYHQQLKTEAVSLTEATHLQVKDEDATDSAAITTQAYVEKYSAVITPTAWMKSYGVRATLIVEYIVKTNPGAGTVSVQTLVGGADAVEKTLLNIAAGKQTAVHTDITDFTSDLTISLEAKNSDAGQTSVLDYCNIYLQIGTKSTARLQLAKITDLKSISLLISQLNFKVWSGAVNNAVFMVQVDDSTMYMNLVLSENGTDMTKTALVLVQEGRISPIDEYISLMGCTNAAADPMVLEIFHYIRAWFE